MGVAKTEKAKKAAKAPKELEVGEIENLQVQEQPRDEEKTKPDGPTQDGERDNKVQAAQKALMKIEGNNNNLQNTAKIVSVFLGSNESSWPNVCDEIIKAFKTTVSLAQWNWVVNAKKGTGRFKNPEPDWETKPMQDGLRTYNLINNGETFNTIMLQVEPV